MTSARPFAAHKKKGRSEVLFFASCGIYTIATIIGLVTPVLVWAIPNKKVA
jgi:hypothetical protein